MIGLFTSIYLFFEKRRPLLFALFLSLSAILAWLASGIRLEEDISRLLPSDRNTQASLTLFRESKFADKIMVAISRSDHRSDPDSVAMAAEDFTSILRRHDEGKITRLQFRSDDTVAEKLFGLVAGHAPLFLEPSDYRIIDSMQTPAGVRKSLERDLSLLQRPEGFLFKPVITRDPSGISLLALDHLRSLQAADAFTLYDGYLFSSDLQRLYLFITPRFPAGNTGENEGLAEALERAADSTQRNHPGISVRYIGAPLIAVSNAKQLRQDSRISLTLISAFLFAFLALCFRSFKAPLLVFIPVIFGMLSALAGVRLWQDSISMLAVAAGSVVMGIAINYSIHVYSHFRQHTRGVDVVKSLAHPLTIGSLTTIGGFWCLRFAQLEMLRDLGLFAALSLTGAALCSLVLLPHLLKPRQEESAKHAGLPGWIDRIASWQPRARPWIFLLIIALTGFFFYLARAVKFEADMSGMSYMSPALRASEAEFNQHTDYGLKSVYLMSEGRTLEEALSRAEQLIPMLDSLRRAGIVLKYNSASRIRPSDSLQKARINAWQTYWTEERSSEYLGLLRDEAARMGFHDQAFDPFEHMLRQPVEQLPAETLQSIGNTYLEDFLTVRDGRYSVMTIARVQPEERHRFYACFQERHEVSVFDKQQLTTQFMGLVREDFTRIAWLTSILVFLALWITFGRIELALVAYLPMLITWIWILGIMSITGITFNIVNIIISALIFGLGDDYSIFSINGLLEEYRSGKKQLHTHRSSILISAITTLAGLGVLFFSGHPAMRSVSLMSMVGITCILFFSQFLIPALFRALITRRTDKGKMPLTAFSIVVSVFAFIYFVCGSVLLWVIGFLLVLLRPLLGTDRAKYYFHVILSAFVRSLVYIMVNVKKTILNPQGEDFSRPAIVIANHQSFLDILVMVMLHPRLVLLTNDWVWNSPVFGIIVRLADYYPVSMGAESGLEKMKAIVEKGYSIVVFPEGTRSPDGKIHRFHKGAFYLAEKLQLDILPVLLHGNRYAMPKSDFVLKNGHLSVQFLPRIRPDDLQYGSGYAQRTKGIAAYFRQAYEAFRQERETPQYFRQLLQSNYIYKGPVLEWYMRVKLRLEGYYAEYHRHLPRQGRFLDVGCGYGFVSYALHMAEPERHFMGIDHDDEKIELAQHNFSRNDSLAFQTADILHFSLESYQGILLLDVLHYLPHQQQEQMLNRLMDALQPGGVLLIKEADRDKEKGHGMTQLTEFFSTRLFRFNKTGREGLHFPQSALILDIAQKKRMQVQIESSSKFTSNQLYIIKHLPDEPEAL